MWRYREASPHLVYSPSAMQEKYSGAFPAWYMNKQHWLGVRLESNVPDDVIRQLLKDGYGLIVDNFSKKKRKLEVM